MKGGFKSKLNGPSLEVIIFMPSIPTSFIFPGVPPLRILWSSEIKSLSLFGHPQASPGAGLSHSWEVPWAGEQGKVC